MVILWMPLQVAVVQAQGSGQGRPSDVVTKQRLSIETLKRNIADFDQDFKEKIDSDPALATIRAGLEDVARKLSRVNILVGSRLTEINARLEQLGFAPPPGQPPDSQITIDERAKLRAEKADIDSLVGEATEQAATAGRMIDDIGEARRQLFTSTLSHRVDVQSLLTSEVIYAYGHELQAITRLVTSWWHFAISFKWRSMVAAAFFAVIAALVLLIGGQRGVGHLYFRDSAIESPSYLSRLAVAFWSTLIQSLTVAVFLATTYFFLNYFNVLRPDIASLIYTLFSVIGIVYFVHTLAQAVICPEAPNWRLLRFAPRPGRILMVLITATATITGIDYLADTVNEIAASPPLLRAGKSFIAAILVGLLIIAIALLKPLEDEETGNIRPWPRAMRFFLYLAGSVPIVAALLGYMGFARFVSHQIVMNGAVLVTMYLGFLTAQAEGEENALAGTTLGQTIQSRFGMDETTLDQLGLITSFVINLLLVILGIPVIMLMWGFQWSEVTANFIAIVTGIQIGSVTISLVAILTGLLLAAIFCLFTRWFQNWFDNRVMARGRLDSGVRNSIRTAVGYLGLGMAAVIGVSAAGINLSSLALVAGGLSLGIGFGMQAIVSNFVSGLILLAERPFKVGDWVEVGDVAGVVNRISVRATEVETSQHQSIMIPNSSLINGNVGNWTRNRLGRVDIPVGVSHKADPRRVHALLMDIAANNPLVLKTPEPFVAFKSIDDATMTFEMRVHLADLWDSGTLQNELRFNIVERFAEQGIEIPCPQRDVNLRLADADMILEFLTKRVRAERGVSAKKLRPRNGSSHSLA